jgi:two-component system osmolarity sensor histidine kinase EnvZ
MNSDIEQMDAIIGQFLDYARPLDSRQGFQNLDLGALVRDALEEIREPASTKGDPAPTERPVPAQAGDPPPRIDVRIDETRPIAGHPIEIRRLLQNLIENARRYGKSAEQDRAEVSVRVFDDPDDGVVLEVSDRGPGIPETEIERLKRPFTRLDSARGQAKGAGLGLAIVERIAQRHGARFSMMNGETGGLVTRIRFPGIP